MIKNNYDFFGGEILLFDKQLNWTSFDLVNKVRWLITKSHQNRKIKVGHAGTLDPLATGLVIICTGKKTKEITEFQNLDKEYVTTIRLGATTPSFDLETEIDKNFEYSHITLQAVEHALTKFIGTQQQIPPVYSAKKINGQRAYKKARKGENVEIKPVTIEIKELELLEYNLPDIKIRIKCSKGTYIRAFARDLGEYLKSGAHLTNLRRTAIGKFSVQQAILIEDFEKIIKNIK